ncbi:PREDICTED: uncharacterized protein LOC109226111 [Nicotiana attenuata]|uniref:uncharacterized protein LOC109226111 n=1 Tax=Nicotiana attenuata TaxID=49451 RepID=UPI0009059781|nr:PREDICTED: uncharacterized protein LOC109226111 [Nicotiana attenuata]
MEEEIEAEVLGYYKQFLGSNAPTIPAIDPNVMQRGTLLKREQKLQLILPITRQEVWKALQDIDDLKALGYDGINAVFFKKSWNIIGEKVLTSRLQGVMDDLIDKTQSAFVPGRVIINNTILSHELVKGYGRKGVSPNCMMKLDMQKAYDSLEWPFLEQVLYALAFPEKFVKWIMTCVQVLPTPSS